MQARVPSPRCWAELESISASVTPDFQLGIGEDRGTIPDIAFTDLDVSGCLWMIAIDRTNKLP